jgi:hypothetical protein
MTLQEISQNHSFVLQNSNEFGKIKFYYNPAVDGVHALYYNPDSYSGGQIVDNYMSIAVLEIFIKNYEHDTEAFFKHFEEYASQTVYDIDTECFSEKANFFINNFYGRYLAAEGETKETIDVIKTWLIAEKVLFFQADH